MDETDIKNRFTFHPVKEGQGERYEKIRGYAKVFALRLNELCPASRKLSLAVTRLEEAVYWANGSIARNE